MKTLNSTVVNVPETKPWTRSWLYYAPGEGPTLLWMTMVHVGTLLGLIFLPLPSGPVFLVALGLTMLGGLGTTLAYHRSLTHKSIQFHPVVEQILIFFAVFNGSGTPRTWVANHRLHHAKADTVEDISSPKHGGFWWAHLRWLWQVGQAPLEKHCPDMNHARYNFWGHMQIPLLAFSFTFGLLWGPTTWLWLGPLRLLVALHVQCTVNSVCHLDRRGTQSDSSKNVWWLSPLHFFQGENWHANHHERQADPKLGQKFWQVDVGWWTIVLLNKLGLVRQLRRPQR